MTAIKMISSKGQLDWGEEYSDRQVLVEEIEPGVWIVKLGRFIPDSERWLHHPKAESEIDEAISWAEHHPPQATNWDDLEQRVEP